MHQSSLWGSKWAIVEHSSVLKAIPTVCPVLCLACYSPGEPQWRQARPHGMQLRVHPSTNNEVSKGSQGSPGFWSCTFGHIQNPTAGIQVCAIFHAVWQLICDVCQWICSFLPSIHTSKQHINRQPKINVLYVHVQHIAVISLSAASDKMKQ